MNDATLEAKKLKYASVWEEVNKKVDDDVEALTQLASYTVVDPRQPIGDDLKSVEGWEYKRTRARMFSRKDVYNWVWNGSGSAPQSKWIRIISGGFGTNSMDINKNVNNTFICEPYHASYSPQANSTPEDCSFNYTPIQIQYYCYGPLSMPKPDQLDGNTYYYKDIDGSTMNWVIANNSLLNKRFGVTINTDAISAIESERKGTVTTLYDTYIKKNRKRFVELLSRVTEGTPYLGIPYANELVGAITSPSTSADIIKRVKNKEFSLEIQKIEKPIKNATTAIKTKEADRARKELAARYDRIKPNTLEEHKVCLDAVELLREQKAAAPAATANARKRTRSNRSNRQRKSRRGQRRPRNRKGREEERF
jgi:hypothetical protein